MERKQTGKILQDTKILWEKTLASLTDAVFIVDPVTRTIVACNPAVENIFGYHQEEVIGKNTEFLHGNHELYEEFGKKLVLALDANGVFHTEHQLRRKNGTPLVSEHTVTEIVDDSGNRIGLVSAVRDITERKRVEKLLKENHELLESIFSSINFLVAYMDTDFNFIRVNRAYADADGRMPEFFVGKNHFDLYPHEENEAIFRKVVETGEPYFAFEKPFQYPERPELGVSYWDWSLIPMKGEGGEVDGLVLCLVDVTKRKYAEKAQRDIEVRFRALFEDLRDAIYITTREGEFVDFNQSTLDLFGYSREELMRMNIRKLYAYPEHRKKFQREMERKGAIKDYEMKFRKKNGRKVDCLITSSLWRADDGSILGYQVITRDITRRRRAEKALRESTRRLRVLSSKLLEVHEAERRHFARELHDTIGGRLAAIKFSLARKLDEMGRGDAQSEVSLEDVIAIVQKTIEEARRISTDLRPSLLDDLGIIPTIDWFCQEFEGIYPRIRIRKEMSIEETEVPEHLKISIFRVFQEAMNNIGQHSNASLVNLHLRETAGSIELAIDDNGKGFDTKEVLAKKSLKDHMGLSSMKERTELSGGILSISSVVGQGTTIRAEWPIKNSS